MNIRRIAFATLAVASTGLAACSSQTRSSIGTGAETTTAPSVLETTTVPVLDTTTLPPVTAPPATAPPATAPPATAPPATAPPATNPPGHSLYDEVSPPNVPSGHTDPFLASGVLSNGVYWVQYNGGETMTPDFDVHQAFFGAECISKAAELGIDCDNDYLVLEDPVREIDNLPFADNVLLTVSDQMTQKSYWITPDELRTIRASSPSDGAPSGFGFSSFPFIMTVQNGKIVKFEQLWVP